MMSLSLKRQEGQEGLQINKASALKQLKIYKKKLNKTNLINRKFLNQNQKSEILKSNPKNLNFRSKNLKSKTPTILKKFKKKWRKSKTFEQKLTLLTISFNIKI